MRLPGRWKVLPLLPRLRAEGCKGTVNTIYLIVSRSFFLINAHTIKTTLPLYEAKTRHFYTMKAINHL